MGHPIQARSYTRLVMFDFDGTLFRSWEKTPEWWDDPTPYSFFLGPGSLAPPCVPDKPGSNYWIHDTVAAARRAVSEAGTYTVLITGRVASHEPRIKDLLSQVGLRLDRHYFNPGTSAVLFKKKVLGSLLAGLNTVKSISIWENENISHYQEYLTKATTALDRDVDLEAHNVQVAPIPLACGASDFARTTRIARRFCCRSLRRDG